MVDCQELNQVTIVNHCWMPLMNKFRDEFWWTEILLKIELMLQNNLLRLIDDNEWKILFRSYYSYFDYLVILFGLGSAPVTI